MAGHARIAAARIAALDLAAARRRLGRRDRRRYGGFRSDKRRREFLAGRALLQLMGLSFDSAPDGSIQAAGRAGASLSHARGWVACVVVSAGRAGVDIEPMVERDFDALARWAFGEDTPASTSREDFYRRWTRHEARIKAFGDAKPRGSHAERTWILGGQVALSVCVPRSSRLSFSPLPRSPRASATRRAAR